MQSKENIEINANTLKFLVEGYLKDESNNKQETEIGLIKLIIILDKYHLWMKKKSGCL